MSKSTCSLSAATALWNSSPRPSPKKTMSGFIIGANSGTPGRPGNVDAENCWEGPASMLSSLILLLLLFTMLVHWKRKKIYFYNLIGTWSQISQARWPFLFTTGKQICRWWLPKNVDSWNFFLNNRFLRERGIVWRPPSKWNTRFFFAFSKRTQPLAKLNWDSQQGKTFSLPSIKNFPISFKPKVAIAEFYWKCKEKSGIPFWGWTPRHASFPQKPVVNALIYYKELVMELATSEFALSAVKVVENIIIELQIQL